MENAELNEFEEDIKPYKNQDGASGPKRAAAVPPSGIGPAFHTCDNGQESDKQQNYRLEDHVSSGVSVHRERHTHREGVNTCGDRSDKDIPDPVQISM